MTVTTTQHTDGIVILKMNGHLNHQTAMQLRAEVMAGVLPGARMLLDMCNVIAISSAAQRIMLLLNRHLQSLGCELILVGMKEPIYTAMEATGFLKYFDAMPALPKGLRAAV